MGKLGRIFMLKQTVEPLWTLAVYELAAHSI